MERIKIKYLQADFPVHIINEVYHRSNQERDELLIPQLLFDDKTTTDDKTTACSC